MTNAHRGEVALKVGDTTYTLVIGRNALAATESVLGKSWSEIAEDLQGAPSFGLLRALFWASLQRKHPAIDLFGAGDLMDEVGDEVLGEKIGEALKLAFPDAESGDNPQVPDKGGAGTQT